MYRYVGKDFMFKKQRNLRVQLNMLKTERKNENIYFTYSW